MTTSPREALERLTRWRDVGDGPDDYTAAGQRFAYDVITLLSLLEWRPISEAPKDGDILIGWHDGERWRRALGWREKFTRAPEFEFATHYVPLPPAPTEDKTHG
jgi:hypothetical protein